MSSVSPLPRLKSACKHCNHLAMHGTEMRTHCPIVIYVDGEKPRVCMCDMKPRKRRV